ncbi:hypothetical protein P9112_013327 [Eukaryota sp. TZLM1-RC]
MSQAYQTRSSKRRIVARDTSQPESDIPQPKSSVPLESDYTSPSESDDYTSSSSSMEDVTPPCSRVPNPSPPKPTDPITTAVSATIDQAEVTLANHNTSKYFLHRIILKGFKSYSHQSPQVVDLSPKLNCICGVNGSGKSNIIEALCFICGYKSNDLRSNGTSSLSFNNNASLEVVVFAEFFTKNELLPFVAIGRKLTNSNLSYVCCYAENDGFDYSKVTTITKIKAQEMLTQIGLDVSVPERWICRQQDTIALLRRSAVGFLTLIERISGIFPLFEHQNRLFIEKKRVDSEIKDLENEKAIIDERIEVLRTHYHDYCEVKNCLMVKKQKNLLLLKCKRFRTDFETKHFEKQKQNVVEELNEIDLNISKLKDQLSSISAKQDKLESVKNELNIELQHVESEMNRIQSERNQELLKIEEIKLTLKSKSNQKTNDKKSLTRLVKNENQLTEEFNGLQAQIEEVELEKGEKEKMIEDLESKMKRSKLNSKEKKQCDLIRKSSEMKIQLEKEITNLSNSKTNSVESYSKAESKVASLTSELLDLRCDLAKLKQVFNCNSTEFKQKVADIEAMERDNFELGERLKYLERSEFDLCRKIENFESSISMKNNSDSLSNFLSEFHQLHPNNEIIGIFSELVGITCKKYSVAVNSALPANLRNNSILVKSRSIATKFINFVKQKAPPGFTVSCEILDQNFVSNSFTGSRNLVNSDKLVLLSQILQSVSPNELVTAFINKLGNRTVLEGSLRSAKETFKKLKGYTVVSNDGIIFKSNGEVLKTAIRGTLIRSISEQSSAWSRSEIDSQLAALRNELEIVLEEKRKLTVQNEKLEKDLEKLKDERNCLHLEIQTIEAQISNLVKKETATSNNLNRTNSTMIRIENEIAKTVEKLNKAEEKLSEIEDLPVKSQKLSMFVELVRKYNENNSEFILLKTKSQQLISNLDLTSEFIKENQQKQTVLKTKIAKLESEIKELQDTVDQFSEIDQAHQDSIQEILSSKREIEKKCELIQGKITKNLEKQEQNQNILIELEAVNVEKEAELSTLEGKLEVLGKETDDICQQLKEQNDAKEIQSEFKHFKKFFNRRSKFDKVVENSTVFISNIEQNLEDIHHKIIALEQRIDKECLSEFLNKSKRSVQLKTQIDTLTSQEAILKSNIDRLLSTRFTLLTKVITLLNRQLSRLFSSLTNGGSLRLELSTNPESLDNEGVGISVKLPNDTWTEYNRLSGGQQAISALGVSLSLFLAFPTPILVADEIDASLDTVAVQRVAKVLQMLSHTEVNPKQILVVSLRRQMYEICNRLVGVYQCNGSSKVLSVDF